MKTTARWIPAGALALALGVAGAPAALAGTAACDEYSEECPVTDVIDTGDDTDEGVADSGDTATDTDGTQDAGVVTTGSSGGTPATAEAGTLPVTGGEATLLLLAGAGAVAGGAALVVASRRRVTT